MRCVSVVIADCHPVVLQGLTSILGPGSGFKVIASCPDGPSFVEAIQTFYAGYRRSRSLIARPDRPGSSGPRQLRETSHAAGIFYGIRSGPPVGRAGSYRCLWRTAKGCGTRSPGAVLAAGRVSARGWQPADQAAAREQRNIAITENGPSLLTDRERQIMTLVSDGLSNKEIARRLNIADGTIKVHLHHIFQKLEISNRTVLAALALSLNDNIESCSRDYSPGPLRLSGSHLQSHGSAGR